MKVRFGVVGLTEKRTTALVSALGEWALLTRRFASVGVPAEEVAKLDVQVLLIDASQEFDDAMYLGRFMVRERPGTVIIALGDGEDSDDLRDVLRAGMADLLNPEKDLDRLKDHIKQVAHKLDADAFGEGEIIAVVGCSGGIGVTTVAVALGQLWGKEGATSLVVDMDQTGGDFLSAMNMAPNFTTHDFLAHIDEMDVTRMRASVEQREAGFWVLPQPEEDVDSKSIAGHDVRPLLGALRLAFDTVIVDMGAGLNESGREVLRMASHIVLVADQEISPLRTAVRRLTILERMDIPKKRIHVILNRYHPRRQPDATEIARQLGHPVRATIGNDYATVNTALDRGVTVLELKPRSGVAQDLEAVRAAILGERIAKKKTAWWRA